MFLHNMRKNKKKFFFTFFDFFDFLEWKYDFLEVIEHFINIFVTKWTPPQKKKIFWFFFYFLEVGVSF